MANTRKTFCVLEIRYICIYIYIDKTQEIISLQTNRNDSIEQKKKKENGKHKECLCVLEIHDSLTFNRNE